jgi:transposase-like protein
MSEPGLKAHPVVHQLAPKCSSLENKPLDSEKPDEMCPACRSEAVYRYGLTPLGKQRFQCLVCGRQFTKHTKRVEIRHRPLCPVCGRPMHAYRRGAGLLRYRCSAYPKCRTFLKVAAESEPAPATP